MKPVVLCILDGVGMRNEVHGNAVKQAKMPNFNMLLKKYPHTLLEASGELVGLPKGQMGNSEVGHMNIGAGRIVYQPLQLINEKIKSGEFFSNEKFLDVINHVKKNNTKLHLCGLASDGGIHSHIDHLMALLELCKKEDVKNVYLHLFLDGRDTLPKVAEKYLDMIDNKCKELKLGKIATIGGRYYGMDRDNRWDRIEKAYLAMTDNIGEHYDNYHEAIVSNYERDKGDEFVIPAIIDSDGMIEDNDGMIVFNFRPDRLRQLFKIFTNDSFNEFAHHEYQNLKVVTMMYVNDEVLAPYAYEIPKLDNTLGEYVSKLGLKQLRIAETEKYAHVTYFFDGGIDKVLDGEDRILVPSPKVTTYDLKPEMSAVEITDKLVKCLDKDYDLIVVNYANGDMVGHTGDMKATIKALETVDMCLGRLYKKVLERCALLVVTADHGNSDIMLDENDNVITSHTTSKVPLIITKDNLELKEGKLGDIAPTILKLMDRDIPKEMTGDILIRGD